MIRSLLVCRIIMVALFAVILAGIIVLAPDAASATRDAILYR